MSKINTIEARDLSLEFDKAATALGKYLGDNYAQLTPKEISGIRSLRWTLLDLAEEITQRAIGVNLSNLEGGLPLIRRATAKASKALAKLKLVGTVISVASSLIDLALAVSSGNLEGIAKSVEILAKAVDSEKTA